MQGWANYPADHGTPPNHGDRAVSILPLFGRGIASATRWVNPYAHKVGK